MLSDPQSVTVNSVAISLPVISRGVNNSVYQAADGNHKLTLSHTYAKRIRRVARWDFRKLAANQFDTTQNQYYSGAWYLVCDQPIAGYLAADLKLQSDGFLAFLAASSYAKITNLLGGES
jgi:hypothetical protein